MPKTSCQTTLFRIQKLVKVFLEFLFLTYVPLDITEEGLMTHTAAHHQGAIEEGVMIQSTDVI